MENKENRIRARIVVEIDGYLDAPLLVASGVFFCAGYPLEHNHK